MRKNALIWFSVILLVVGIVALYFTFHKTGPIPSSVLNQASFSIFYPQSNQPTIIPETATVMYDKASNAVSFDISVNGKRVAVSEQATPDIFSQNGVYDFKLNQANQYDSFQTAAGEVTLTKPTELNGQTVAWVNAKGTLTLARAFQNLNEAEWKQLFNSMEAVR